MSERVLKYTEALREATDQVMAEDSSVCVFGLGVTYKNGADGTTAGLKKKYPTRVFDTPVSEHAVTGMAVGSAISGMRPIVHHGRVEFSLLAADQMFTQAAKWNYMFGGGNPVPVVFRIAVGRQWGNGPQHTQSLYGMFGSVSGLKVVIPSSPKMAKGLLVAAVRDPNPVVVLEPRWLYALKQHVPEGIYTEALEAAQIVQSGTDVTVVSYGDGLIAAQEACGLIGTQVSVELIDLISINPIDYETVIASVRKTGRLLVVDTTHASFGVGSEIIAGVAKAGALAKVPIHLSCPEVPCPTSTALTEDYYPTKVSIANEILRVFNRDPIERMLSFEELHLAPNITLP